MPVRGSGWVTSTQPNKVPIGDGNGDSMKYGTTAMGLGFGLTVITSVYIILYPTLIGALQAA